MPYNRLWRAAEATLDAPLRARKAWRWRLDGDLFHESVPDAWIDQVFAVMALAPQHTFQVLTKRSARMRAYVSDPGVARRIWELVCDLTLANNLNVVLIARGIDARMAPPGPRVYLDYWPLRNVWLMVSAEDQPRLDERLADLLATPAAVRGLSAEPLLGPIDLVRVMTMRFRGAERLDALTGELEGLFGDPAGRVAGLDWVIAGGESGPGARPMHPDWARQIRDDCAAASVPFFFKQWGAWREAQEGDTFNTAQGRGGKPPALIVDPDNGTVHCFLPDQPNPRLRVMLEVGKTAAGRLLDGVEHNGFPKTAPLPDPIPANLQIR